MKGNKRQKVIDIKDQLVGANRAYTEGKNRLVEQSITRIESRRDKWIPLPFFAILIVLWIIAIFLTLPVDSEIDVKAVVTAITIFFFISYFAFFHASKMVVRPTVEELEDDTSYLALFSACESRERRGLLSAIFGVAHTVVFGLYIILKYTGVDAWRLF